MKAETLQKRIEERLFTKAGRLAKRYETLVDDVLLRPKAKHHLLEWRYSGGYVNMNFGTFNGVVDGLKLLNLSYEMGNDAPRGGKNGDYILLTPKSQKAVAPWVKWRRAELKKEYDALMAKRKQIEDTLRSRGCSEARIKKELFSRGLLYI